MKKIFNLVLSILSILALCLTISANVGFAGESYETPDTISISDLKQGTTSAGNKIVLDKHQNYTYEKNAKYGSVVFKFKYKITKWSVDDDGCQFHLSSSWQMDGMFWIRPDKIRIAYLESGNSKYAEGSAITAGTHEIELGRLAVMNGETYTGKQYYYVKVDGVLNIDYTQSGLSETNYKNNGLFFTGKAGNILLDNSYEGSKVTFKSNGETFQEFNTLADYIEKPEQDPAVPGKTFVGWFDALGNEWDFENNAVTGNMTLTAGFKGADYDTTNEVYFSDSTYTPVLRFMVSSDVHIGNNESVRNTRLQSAIDKAYEIANANAKYNKLDAVLFAGDVSDNGEITALTAFKTTADAKIQNGTQLLVTMGNHDFRGANALEAISQFEQLFGADDFSVVINGYYFIGVSPDLNEGINFSDTKINWLDQKLAEAQQADPTKPIFVMQHEGVTGTIYGSKDWGVTDLATVLEKYPQVVDFSGHSHYPLSDPRSIWQGVFTALGTGTLHYYETGINNYKTGGVFPYDEKGGWSVSSSSGSTAAEFLVVEIDANNAMRVIVYDLLSGSEITRYYMRNLTDDIKFDYSHTERAKSSVAPTFDPNDEITFAKNKGVVTISFPQATSVSTVESYRIEVYKGSTYLRTEYVLSNYFRKPMPTSIECSINKLLSDTTYSFKIYAVNAWGDESVQPLTGSVTTDVFEYEAEEFAAFDDLSVLDVAYPDNTGILSNIPTEYGSGHQYSYNGTSPSYSARFQCYLITGNLTSTDEFRIQVGTLDSLFCTFWIQTGKYDVVFFSWAYSDSPSDRVKYEIKSNTIYKLEMATLFVEVGEHAGQSRTYVKINDQVIKDFYCNSNECQSSDYQVAFHVSTNYKIADINLERTIEYYVDDQKVSSEFAINGIATKAIASPSKPNLYFVGWYTEPTGGERVDFSKPVSSEEKTIKYYARFTDETFNAKFYNEDGTTLIENQVVGKDCEVVKIADPEKTGQYQYSFVKWEDMATGKEFDFSTRLQGDVNLKAVFEEYKYKIYYLVDGVEYTVKYYVESDPTTIIDGEPAVPALEGANGYWEYSAARDKADIYASARYNGVPTAGSNDIKLNAFKGSTVDIADDLTRFYLSFADTELQATWLQSYPVEGGHERQDISFSWTDSSRNMAYLVYFADNDDFNNAFIVRTETRSIDYVGIFTPGKTYYWKVCGLSNSTWSEIDSFTVLNSGVRWISADTVFNMRDMGGWTTTDGKVLNYGLIYRGGQLSLDNTGEKSYMSDYSFKVFDYLGIKTEIELRGDYPHDLNQINALNREINVNGKGYAQFFNVDNNAKAQYREVFEALADISNYPFYYHCSWGADRTGGLGFVIGAVLGVPYEQLCEDYELTSLSHSGSRTRYGYDSGAFNTMYESFMSIYSDGGTLQYAVNRWLTTYIGVPQANIDAMKTIMLSENTNTLTYHEVTFKVDDEIYQVSNVIDGNVIKAAVPFYFERHLVGWKLNDAMFDLNTKVTTDLVLDAVFEETTYEDYDTLTIRDLGLGEQANPAPNNNSYEGTAATHGRLLVFDYKITATDGKFDDGVHISFSSELWDWKAQVWFASATTIHVFAGNEKPAGSYPYTLSIGTTYRITAGIIIPINGEFAGKKMFLVKVYDGVNDNIICFMEAPADIENSYKVGIAGTEGILMSVDNNMSVKFIGTDGLTTLETKVIQRGNYVEAIQTPAGGANQVFLGWFDEYGNKWDFAANKVLRNMSLVAKYGDRTIDAMVVDEDGVEIQNAYKVKLGLKVSEIETPIVSNNKLEFDGWYNGSTKLADTDVITEEMNLICKFKAKAQDNPGGNDDPGEQPAKKGCRSSLAIGYGIFAMISLTGALIIKKRRSSEE